MPHQFVCLTCWRWYEGGTVCKSCKGPLSYGGRGAPRVLAAPEPRLPSGRTMPEVSGYPGGLGAAPPGAPPVSGYPDPPLPPPGPPAVFGQAGGPSPSAAAPDGHAVARYPATVPVATAEPPREIYRAAAPAGGRGDDANPATVMARRAEAAPAVPPTYEGLGSSGGRLQASPPGAGNRPDQGIGSQPMAGPDALSYRLREAGAGVPVPTVLHAAVYAPAFSGAAAADPVTLAVGPQPDSDISPPPAQSQPVGQRLIVGAAGGVVAGVLTGAVWVLLASLTGADLAPVAILVGAAVGLGVRRLGVPGRPNHATAAGAIAATAICLSGLFVGVAVAAHAAGSGLLVGLATLDKSYLPLAWRAAGPVGVVCGTLGTVAAVAAVLIPGCQARAADRAAEHEKTGGLATTRLSKLSSTLPRVRLRAGR